MYFFLCMKIDDSNNGIPLMTEHNEDVSVLVDQAETMFELLTREKSWDRAVIDNNFDSRRMSDAGMKLIDREISEFEWKFYDKYGRLVRCYITRNV